MKRKTSKGIQLIKKANDLIESRYKFDIWETRVFLSVLAQIRREDDEFRIYRIWHKDVIRNFGLKSGDSYKYLRNAAASLKRKEFIVKYEVDGQARQKRYSILRMVDTAEGEGDVKEKQDYIEVMVEDVMRPLLLELQKNFTAYDLKNVVKLGVYPIRVYELIKQYQSIGWRKIGVEEMKIMFGVSDQYKLFGDFYRWVIKPAEREINKHTDLVITGIEKVKEGRRVVALRFHFRKKTEKELEKIQLKKMKGKIQEKFNLQPSNSAKRVELSSEEKLRKATSYFINHSLEENQIRTKFGDSIFKNPDRLYELLKREYEAFKQ